MSNKLELQNNNIDLQGILTKVNTLPKKENIDEEVDTIENLTEQIKLALEGKAAGGKIFAAIGVTYPEGSVCTCTNGTKTMEAGNTNGQWVFAIPETEIGTWTVTSTDPADSSRTKSVSYEISAEGQWEYAILRYALDIIKNGYAKVQFNLADTPVENDGDGYYRCWEARYLVDVTNYSALKIDGKYLAGNGGAGNVNIQVLYESGTVAATQTLTTGRDTYTIDLSNQTGIRQIYWRTYGYNTDTQGYKSSVQVFYNMWLEQ